MSDSYFASLNRNKQSVQLDIAEAADREVALTLIDIVHGPRATFEPPGLEREEARVGLERRNVSQD